MQLYRFPTIMVLIGFASVPALPQNGNARHNSGQAMLRLTVNVASTVILQPVSPSHPLSNNVVIFNVPAARPDVEVKEEVRPLSALAVLGKAEGALLKTTTVVVH
jgi:hypothetical protein